MQVFLAGLFLGLGLGGLRTEDPGLGVVFLVIAAVPAAFILSWWNDTRMEKKLSAYLPQEDESTVGGKPEKDPTPPPGG